MEMDEPTTEVLGFIPRTEAKAEHSLCLVVVAGPEKGSVFGLEEGIFTLGRSAQHANFVVSGRGLSRAHARFEVGPAGVVVADLGSTNGTFVNGQRIEADFPLQVGDSLTLGPDVILRLDASDQSILSLLSELHRGATLDALTGLLNRRSFMERLSEECSATQRHSLLTCLAIMDVDFFKKVNDTYGHPAGDAVLVEVAARLAKSVRNEDVVARYGGEEFVLLMRQTGAPGAMCLMDRIRLAVCNQPIELPGGGTLSVSISAGVCQWSASMTAENLLEKADAALYEAKRAGRNRVELAD
jgi:two-component system cell cycle response regulator